MLVGELESLNQTKCLIDRSTNGQVIDGDLSLKMGDLAILTWLYTTSSLMIGLT
jgi:hypothetical protein